jgi:thiol-disulfide isomerase/thioredoxin
MNKRRIKMLNNILITLILIILVGVLVVLYYMLKYNSNFLKQIQSIKGIQFNTLDIGQEAPLFRIYDNERRRIVAKELFYNDKNTLILFVNSLCPLCKAILKKIDIIQNNYNLNILVINNDETLDDSEVKNMLKSSIIYIRSSYISTAYKVYTTPLGVLIEKGKVKQYSKVSNFNLLNNLLITEEHKQIS